MLVRWPEDAAPKRPRQESGDSSGTIRVITGRGLPSEGRAVSVTGMVNQATSMVSQAFKLGPAEVIVILEPAEGDGSK